MTTGASGFPTQFELVYFLPLNLGSPGATDWDAEALAPHLPEILQRQPELVDDHILQGNIHSHHTMGAFFSNTDQSTLVEHARNLAPGAFYPSLVVASEKEPYAFAFSYPDQYDYIHIVEGDVEEPLQDVSEAWVTEADAIAAAKKAADAAKKAKWTQQQYASPYGGKPYGSYSHERNQLSILPGWDDYDDGKGYTNMDEVDAVFGTQQDDAEALWEAHLLEEYEGLLETLIDKKIAIPGVRKALRDLGYDPPMGEISNNRDRVLNGVDIQLEAPYVDVEPATNGDAIND